MAIWSTIFENDKWITNTKVLLVGSQLHAIKPGRKQPGTIYVTIHCLGYPFGTPLKWDELRNSLHQHQYDTVLRQFTFPSGIVLLIGNHEKYNASI
jgi:hypothetical protein